MAKILLQYDADINQLKTELQKVEVANKKVDDSAKKAGKDLTKSYLDAANAAGKVQRETTGINSELKNTSLIAQSANNVFGQIAAGIGAAFTVNKIIEFSKASIRAFEESEAKTNRLKFALESITKEGGAFDDLVKQSEQLQDKLKIFDSEDIQQIQAMQVQYGLTAEQVKKLTPLILELSVAQGSDLVSATDTALKAIEGQTRGLKSVGASFDDAGNSVGNFNLLIEKLGKLEGVAADQLDTATGQMKAQQVAAENLEEAIGAKLSPRLAELRNTVLLVSKDLVDFFFPDSARTQLEKNVERVKSVLGVDTSASVKQLKEELSLIPQKIADIKNEAKNLPVDFDRGDKLEALRLKLQDLKLTEIALKEIILEKQAAESKADSEKKKNLELEKLQKEDISKLDQKQLNFEIEALKKRSDVNTKVVEDEINRRKEAVDKLKESSKNTAEDRSKSYDELLQLQKEYEQKSLESAAKSEAEKLDLQRQAILKKAEEAFKKAGGTINDQGQLAGDTKAVEAFLKAKANINATYDKLISDATVKAAEQTAKELDRINKQNLSDDLAATLNAIDTANEKKKQLEIQGFIERGDFSKQAYQKLQDELLLIDKDTFDKQNQERVKSGEEAVTNEADITAAALQGASDRVDVTADEEERKRQLREQGFEAVLNNVNQLDALISQATENEISQIEERKNAQLAAFDEQLAALEQMNERGAYSDRVYNDKKKELLTNRTNAEKKADAELRKLKREQAEQDKLKAIFDIIVNTSVAVSKLLATPFLAIAAGAAGALELAKVISTPIPKFFLGEKYVKRGKNPMGIDTIPAMLNEGERIISTEKNKKHWAIYEAIENNEFQKFVQKHYVMPQLRAYKAEQESKKQKEFAGNIAASIIGTGQGLTFYDADRIRKKGMHINNAKELSVLIAEAVYDRTPKYYGKW